MREGRVAKSETDLRQSMEAEREIWREEYIKLAEELGVKAETMK
jgi:hypothetical protein